MTEGTHETQTRIAKIEQEIVELKRKMSRVFTILDISTTKELFLRLMVSLDATESQEAEVYDLMAGVDSQLSERRADMDHFEFCDRPSKVVPGHQPQHLAEAVVTRLAQDGGWDQVYKHLRQRGMKLRDLREERGF